MERRDEKRDSKDIPEEVIEKEGAEARRELDEIPPPGTDPLHEGP